MKTNKIFNLSLFVSCTLLSASGAAGRYDGISDIFSNAAKHFEPPPPREFNLNHNGGANLNPPGSNGPDINMPQNNIENIIPQRSLTDEFNYYK